MSAIFNWLPTMPTIAGRDADASMQNNDDKSDDDDAANDNNAKAKANDNADANATDDNNNSNEGSALFPPSNDADANAANNNNNSNEGSALFPASDAKANDDANANAADDDDNSNSSEGSALSPRSEKKWYEDQDYKDAKHFIIPPPSWDKVDAFRTQLMVDPQKSFSYNGGTILKSGVRSRCEIIDDLEYMGFSPEGSHVCVDEEEDNIRIYIQSRLKKLDKTKNHQKCATFIAQHLGDFPALYYAVHQMKYTKNSTASTEDEVVYQRTSRGWEGADLPKYIDRMAFLAIVAQLQEGLKNGLADLGFKSGKIDTEKGPLSRKDGAEGYLHLKMQESIPSGSWEVGFTNEDALAVAKFIMESSEKFVRAYGSAIKYSAERELQMQTSQSRQMRLHRKKPTYYKDEQYVTTSPRKRKPPASPAMEEVAKNSPPKKKHHRAPPHGKKFSPKNLKTTTDDDGTIGK